MLTCPRPCRIGPLLWRGCRCFIPPGPEYLINFDDAGGAFLLPPSESFDNPPHWAIRAPAFVSPYDHQPIHGSTGRDVDPIGRREKSFADGLGPVLPDAVSVMANQRQNHDGILLSLVAVDGAYFYLPSKQMAQRGPKEMLVRQVALGSVCADDADSNRRTRLLHHPSSERLLRVPAIEHRDDGVDLNAVCAAASFVLSLIEGELVQVVGGNPGQGMR
jgi:hypothetical protein